MAKERTLRKGVFLHGFYRYVFSVVPNYFQNYRIQIDSKSNSLAIPHRGSIWDEDMGVWIS
ncbi:hypothetical protein HYC85_027490 [Camellia sinensis]|uniref:Uncharacterized protein n=2 Tax=Camellia sinensis TaxID=4442 RepID=A0A7J7G8X1_CAMSI|nr:hypothetical protein HYC85_027490 [Camellia sinensis]